MLGEAKTQNDVLSQAYADLKAEYVNLKTSSAVGTGDHQQHHHNQHHQQHQQHPASYSLAGPAADMGGGYVDPTMASLHAGSDLDAYLYPEVGGYSCM